MVIKQVLMDEVTAKASIEAKARGLDGYAFSDFVDEAVNVVEDFFWSMTWTEVVDGVIQSKESLPQWRHRQLEEFENDWLYLELDREGLRGAAERYLERPWMHCNKMDWLILNVLTYAEYQGFVDQLRSKTMPLQDYVSLRCGGKKKSSFSFVEWGTAVGLFCGFTWIWPPLGVAYGAYVCWRLWKRRSAKQKIAAIQNSMSATYGTFSTVSQSWQLVWDELMKSRKAGVVWDGVVYRLVEDRMSTLSQPQASHPIPL